MIRRGFSSASLPVLFSLLSVVVWESVAFGDLLLAPRAETISKADDALAPLAKQFPDARAGFRGSLARGTKGARKGGGPFDPTNFDVDAFIVSDDLAAAIPKAAKGFRNLGRLPEHRGLIKSISDKLRGIPGHRDEAVKIQVFSVEEFNKLLPNEIHLLN